MKKSVIVFLLSVTMLIVFGPEAQAQIPKEGSVSNLIGYSGTYKAIAMGKERVHMAYEVLGAVVSDTGEGLLHNSSMHCLGALHVVNGEYDNDFGFCAYTRPDGDQLFMTYKAAGKMGATGKGTAIFVGGTGKLTGIQGSSEFNRFSLRPSAQGTLQGYNRAKGKYKLP